MSVMVVVSIFRRTIFTVANVVMIVLPHKAAVGGNVPALLVNIVMVYVSTR